MHNHEGLRQFFAQVGTTRGARALAQVPLEEISSRHGLTLNVATDVPATPLTAGEEEALQLRFDLLDSLPSDLIRFQGNAGTQAELEAEGHRLNAALEEVNASIAKDTAEMNEGLRLLYSSLARAVDDGNLEGVDDKVKQVLRETLLPMSRPAALRAAQSL